MIFITEGKRNHAFKIQENSSLCVDLYYSAWLVNFSQSFLTFQWWCLNTNCVSYRQELISEMKKIPKILKSCIQKKGPAYQIALVRKCSLGFVRYHHATILVFLSGFSIYKVLIDWGYHIQSHAMCADHFLLNIISLVVNIWVILILGHTVLISSAE